MAVDIKPASWWTCMRAHTQWLFLRHWIGTSFTHIYYTVLCSVPADV